MCPRDLRLRGELAGLCNAPLSVGFLATTRSDLCLVMRDVCCAARNDGEGCQEADGRGREPSRRAMQPDVLAVEIVFRPSVERRCDVEGGGAELRVPERHVV